MVNSKATLYEYAVLLYDFDEDDRVEGTSLIVGPVSALAPNEDVVRARAARDIPAEYEGRLDDVEILVRPFV